MKYLYVKSEKLLKFNFEDNFEVKLISENFSNDGYQRIYDIVGRGTIDITSFYSDNEKITSVETDIKFIKLLYELNMVTPNPYENM